jgi:branched-chain amino acid transport system permease protein
MKRVSPLALAALAVGIAVLLALPHALKPYGIYLISAWAVFSIAAIGLNLTLGYAGQVSLAQAAFVGIGAYTAALLTTSDWPFFVAFVLRACSASPSAGCWAIRPLRSSTIISLSSRSPSRHWST